MAWESQTGDRAIRVAVFEGLRHRLALSVGRRVVEFQIVFDPAPTRESRVARRPRGGLSHGLVREAGDRTLLVNFLHGVLCGWWTVYKVHQGNRLLSRGAGDAPWDWLHRKRPVVGRVAKLAGAGQYTVSIINPKLIE